MSLDRPLTPKELEDLQKKQPPSSPWNPGQSPAPSKKSKLAYNKFSGKKKEINDV
tara:strand:- start:139 stop:303 length:165 start_codon:yes stop_codon:yes gene_type:complete